MAKSKKKDLTPEQVKEATAMLNAKMSWGRVARYFGVNKPSLLKSLGLWETGKRTTSDGREYRMVRGRAMFKAPAFEVKDLPPKKATK